MILRYYQTDAANAVDRDLPTHGSCLVVLPTGTGKTLVIAEVALRYVLRGLRVLVVTHRRELIEQSVGKLRDRGMVVGIERARIRSAGERVVVASVQTLRTARLETLGDPFDLVILDETHHAVSKVWQRVIDFYPLARVFGVTATPDRLDGVGLGKVFKHVSYHMTIRRAIDEKWLVPIRALRITVPGMDLSQVRERRGDLHPRDLSRAANNTTAVEGITGPLVATVGNARLRTVVFAVDVAHAEALVSSLQFRGIRAAVVHGEQPDKLRKNLIERFRAGQIQILVNAQLLVEGWDDPGVQCVAMCRPTESRAWYTQAVGRGLRPAIGKLELLLLDFSGVGSKHSLACPEDLLGHDLWPVPATPRAKNPMAQRGKWLVSNPDAMLRHQVALFNAMHEKPRGIVAWFKSLWS